MLCPMCHSQIQGKYGKKTCSPKCRKAFSRLNEADQERAIRDAEKVEHEEHARRYARPLVNPLSMSAAKYDADEPTDPTPAPPSVTPAAILGRNLGRALEAKPAEPPPAPPQSVTSTPSAPAMSETAATPAPPAPAPESVTPAPLVTETRPLTIEDMARRLYSVVEGRILTVERLGLEGAEKRKLDEAVKELGKAKRYIDKGDGVTASHYLHSAVNSLSGLKLAGLPALDLSAIAARFNKLPAPADPAPRPYRLPSAAAIVAINNVFTDCQALEASTSAPRVHLACFIARDRAGQARERLKADPAARVEGVLERAQFLLKAARRYARAAEAGKHSDPAPAEAEAPAPESVTMPGKPAEAEAPAPESVTSTASATKRPRPPFIASKPKRGFWLYGDACITRAGRIGIVTFTPTDRAVIVEDVRTGVKARHYVERLSADVWGNFKQWRMREVWAREHTDLPAQYIHIYDQASTLLNDPRIDARQYSDKGQKKQVERIRGLLVAVSQYMREGKASVAYENLKLALEGIKAVFGNKTDEEGEEVNDLPTSHIEAVKCDIEVNSPAGEHTAPPAVSAAKCDIDVSPPADEQADEAGEDVDDLPAAMLYCGNCGEEHQRAARMPDICPSCGDMCTWLSEPPRRRIYTPKKPAPTSAPPASHLDAQPSVTMPTSATKRPLYRPEIY